MGFLCYSSLGSKHVSETTTVVTTYWLGDLNCTQLGPMAWYLRRVGAYYHDYCTRLLQVMAGTPTLAKISTAIRLKDGQWNKMGILDFLV